MLPGWIALYAVGRVKSPNGWAAVVVGSTFLRLCVVLGGGAALYYTFDQFTVRSLLVWLMVFYVPTLALETAFVVASKPQ